MIVPELVSSRVPVRLLDSSGAPLAGKTYTALTLILLPVLYEWAFGRHDAAADAGEEESGAG